jgi:hypothetical protein
MKDDHFVLPVYVLPLLAIAGCIALVSVCMFWISRDY